MLIICQKVHKFIGNNVGYPANFLLSFNTALSTLIITLYCKFLTFSCTFFCIIFFMCGVDFSARRWFNIYPRFFILFYLSYYFFISLNIRQNVQKLCNYWDKWAHHPPTTDEDECSLGRDSCHSNATCANTKGSYTCTCDKGYTGDGKDCKGIIHVH